MKHFFLVMKNLVQKTKHSSQPLLEIKYYPIISECDIMLNFHRLGEYFLLKQGFDYFVEIIYIRFCHG